MNAANGTVRKLARSFSPRVASLASQYGASSGGGKCPNQVTARMAKTKKSTIPSAITLMIEGCKHQRINERSQG